MELSILLAEQIFSASVNGIDRLCGTQAECCAEKRQKGFGFHCSLCVSAVYRI